MSEHGCSLQNKDLLDKVFSNSYNTLGVYPALIQQKSQLSFGGITVELIFYAGGQI